MPKVLSRTWCARSLLLLTSMLALAFDAQRIKGEIVTVYIKGDGTIEPSDAPISSVENATHTLTGDILIPIILVSQSREAI